MRLLLRLFYLIAFLYAFIIPAISQEEIDPKEKSINSSKPQKFDSPLTKLVNKPGVADAYPFLSGDGLRLYFTSNREGGHGRFFISTRKNVTDPFGEPVVLSKNLTDGYYAGSLTADELTLCMVKSGKMYISKRISLTSEFSEPVQVKGIKENYHFGPSISPDGNDIIVMSSSGSNDIVKIYNKVSGTEYRETGELPIPDGSDPGPGQFSKDGLSYYFSFENPGKEVSIWRYTRRSVADKFVDLEELPVKINALQRNFQPTVNADASIIVHTTSQNDLWEEDDIVLVIDPDKALTAPEQFTSVLKNNDNSLTVKNKITTLQVKTFPNPFLSDIILEMSELPSDGTTFILYDLGGKMIKHQRIISMRSNIQLGNLPSAIYIYQVIDGKKKLISSGKLVKG
jgi:hypothetical protein